MYQVAVIPGEGDAFRYLVLNNFTSMIYESRVVFLSKVGSLPVDLSVPWRMWQGARYLYRCKLQTRSTRLIYYIASLKHSIPLR